MLLTLNLYFGILLKGIVLIREAFMADKVILVCEECLGRNYSTLKNKNVLKVRLELKKYCPTCNKHTLHKETK